MILTLFRSKKTASIFIESISIYTANDAFCIVPEIKITVKDYYRILRMLKYSSHELSISRKRQY